MKNILLLIVSVLLMTACSFSESPDADAQRAPLATAPLSFAAPVTGVTPQPTASPTVDLVQTAQWLIQMDQLTSTAASAQRAQATADFWAGVTLAVGTERAMETRVAKTEYASQTQSAMQTAIPPTQTALAATQILEADKLQAERVSTWIRQVGGAILLVSMLGLLVVAGFVGVRFADEKGKANIMMDKTNALKPDQNGRRAAVPSSVLKKGERLILPELAHRGVIDPLAADDLTAAQALQNVGDQRKLETVRSLSNSPVMPAMLRRMADGYVKQMAADIQITRPEGVPTPASPLLEVTSLPALPTPPMRLLYDWDRSSKLLPYGADEDQNLMMVNPTRRPHMMVTGDSGSGKTRSAIRTLMTGALASGWNVVVIGKQVDFLPFEDHPNCTIIPVNVRKQASKYAQILRTLAEQMDIRDQLMASKGVTTWERYGAPQTMIVLDDYSGAMFAMPKPTRIEVLNEAKSIAMDGRKFGLNLVLGLQRASYTSIDTDLRSQMGRIVYRVATAGDSRIALDESGAEALPPLNFLSRLTDDSTIQHGVGFFLQDADVRVFHKDHAVPQNDPIDWVDATVTAEDEAEAMAMPVPTAGLTRDDVDQRVDETLRIQDIYLAAMNRRAKPSLRAIEREVFGNDKGGQQFIRVKKAISIVEGCEVDDVSKVIDAHVAEWRAEEAATKSATNGAATVDLGDLSPEMA